MRCLPLPLCHFLCFRLCLYFHCVMSSSLASPHPLSAHPSLVVLPDYQHVAIPFIAASSICFSFSSSSRSPWFLRLFLHQSLPLFFLFLLSFFSAPLFLHSYSVSLLFPSPIIYPIIFNPSYHFFLPISSSSFFTLQFSLTFSATLPLHPYFPTWFPPPAIPPYAHHSPHNLLPQHDIYRISPLCSSTLPVQSPPVFPFLILIHQYLFIFFSGVLMLSSSLSLPVLLICLPLCHILTFFTCVNLRTAFKHQTSFILSSLFFLILSPCCSSFWLYLTLVSCFPIAELWFLYILIEMEYAQ